MVAFFYEEKNKSVSQTGEHQRGAYDWLLCFYTEHAGHSLTFSQWYTVIKLLHLAEMQKFPLDLLR